MVGSLAMIQKTNRNHNVQFVKNLANSSMELSKPLLQQKN